MAEFKFVQWGEGIPVDYQRLNAMMLNDQYLNDRLDPSPRGILAWAQYSGTLSYSGSPGALGNTIISGFDGIDFSCEANRMIKFTFDGLYADEDSGAGNNIYIIISLDGTETTVTATRMEAGTFGDFPKFTYITQTALSAGTHSITLKTTGYDDYKLVGPMFLTIEDIGMFVSSTS